MSTMSTTTTRYFVALELNAKQEGTRVAEKRFVDQNLPRILQALNDALCSKAGIELVETRARCRWATTTGESHYMVSRALRGCP
jgi:hypothetical protein